MKVAVTIESSAPPRDQDIDNLQQAAAQLTDNRRSVAVQTSQTGDRFFLTTNFTMRTAAQYKVVDDISKEFKFWTVDLAGYQDMAISFPK